MKTQLCIILLATKVCFAAVFWVDYADGNNANSGTNPATAWQHCPGDTALISGSDTTWVNGNTSTSKTWNLITTTNVENGYVVVALNGRYPQVPVVSFAGSNLTQIAAAQAGDGTSYVFIYGRTVGSLASGTNAVVVTATYSEGFAGVAGILRGIVQTNAVYTNAASATPSCAIYIPPHGYGMGAVGTFLGNVGSTYGTQRAAVDASGVKMGAATTTDTGNRTFTFSGSGYNEPSCAVSFNILTAPGPASTQLAAGDTVRFKGGVSYVLTGSGGIVMEQSGGVGNPITFDGNYAGDWGTGKALVTDNYGTAGRTAFYFPFGAGSNVVIRNFDIGKMGGAVGLPSDTNTVMSANAANGIAFQVGAQNVVIADCYFHELGYFTNKIPIANAALAGHGIYVIGASSGQAYETKNLLITNCELTKVRNPIQIQAYKDSTDIEIVDCYIHDYMEWAMDISYTSDIAYFENLAIHDNRLVDFDKWYSTGLWTGRDEAPHQNGIYWRCDIHVLLSPSPTNINIFNNTFRATGQWSGGTTALYLDGDNRANIFNNLFDNTQPANASVQLQLFSSTNRTTRMMARVFNNTFWTTKTALSAGAAMPYYNDWPAGNKLWVTNNIFVNPLQGQSYQFIALFNFTNFFLLAATTNSIQYDYNSFETYNLGGTNLVYIYSTESPQNYYGFNMTNTWAYGWNTHSLLSASRAQFVDQPAGDYRLQEGSPQIDAGANLTALALSIGGGLTNLLWDADGNLRPTTGAWDMGAFQYASESPSPPGPTNTITGQITGTIYLLE